MTVSVTAQQIRASARGPVNESNMNSVLVALDRYGADMGMDRVHRVVQFLAQLMHESGNFRYDREIWGPTPAQQRYDTRTDLGNTPQIDGDGKKYMGRTGIQLTGQGNYKAFHYWCDEKGYHPPDFVRNPDLVNTDPWEGLAPLWYWENRALNRLADQGDIETITKKINGGINGLADRIDHYVRLSLVVLGYAPDAVKQFQLNAGLATDGDPGPKTRAALHTALLALSGASTKMAAFQAAPVVEERQVVPAAIEAQVKKKFNFLGWISGLLTGGGGLSIAALGGFDWKALAVLLIALPLFIAVGIYARQQIIAAIRDIRAAVEN
ncbi:MULTISPECIES: glycoside hydrolase family 19 protein [unclassified Rhizobium]|uniref:glycoside hydrolase family 19 protein n=1 Tax=unclassified Rhizobium TaxID=2613769 RepID=UPI001ADCD4B7|nr:MULTISPECIES: glycoside hydrolase family 19 protein [unclassified Rhizobium]MBO9125443.1 glycoside hydrolase family 19 protein [Rhizobium sp. 16-488-2b]MBO9176028.1 glycoside hydrolase family 19 protein [Rhizobium sp. 16-488-2a]